MSAVQGSYYSRNGCWHVRPKETNRKVFTAKAMGKAALKNGIVNYLGLKLFFSIGKTPFKYKKKLNKQFRRQKMLSICFVSTYASKNTASMTKN